MKTKIMTVDLEPDLRSKECKSIEIVLPKLLDFFDNHNIKATFFIVTSLLEKYEQDIREIQHRGHEIASHSHTHSWFKNKEIAESEIKTSKEKLEEYGFKCLGFRAPKFLTTENHFQLLEKYGYKYDSSFNGNFEIKNVKGIKSITLPASISGLSYLKLFYPFSKLFPKSKIFYLHPWEFLEKKDLPKGNSIKKILLRHNSGQKAWNIFRKHLQKEEQDKVQWISCQEYLKKH